MENFQLFDGSLAVTDGSPAGRGPSESESVLPFASLPGGSVTIEVEVNIYVEGLRRTGLLKVWDIF